MKYKYVGEGEVNLPKFGVTVKSGEVFETDEKLDNPDFEVVSEADNEKKNTKK